LPFLLENNEIVWKEDGGISNVSFKVSEEILMYHIPKSAINSEI